LTEAPLDQPVGRPRPRLSRAVHGRARRDRGERGPVRRAATTASRGAHRGGGGDGHVVL